LTVGGQDLTRFAKGQNPSVSWFQVASGSANDAHWSLVLPSIKVGNRSQPLESRVAILDTGTSHVRVPSDDFDLLTTLLEEHSRTSCTQSEAGNLECACGLRGSASDFPNLYFNFLTAQNEDEDAPAQQDERFLLTPDDYMTKLGLTCYMKFNRLSPSKDSGKRAYWVLGATFLKKYYTIFDLEKHAVGLSQSPFVPSHSSWPQIKYFVLRACMLVSLFYILIYELLFVRVLQQRLHVCERRGDSRKKRSTAKKQLVDNEAEMGTVALDDPDLSFSSDQQSSSYDESCSNLYDSD